MPFWARDLGIILVVRFASWEYPSGGKLHGHCRGKSIGVYPGMDRSPKQRNSHNEEKKAKY